MRDILLYGIYQGCVVKDVCKIDPWWLLREYEAGRIVLDERVIIVAECEIAQQTE